MIPAERRLPEAPGLVEQGGYFVVHAPRQTGKTTALRALAEHLPDRPDFFPAAVALCGLRISSPFNIKLESLRLGDFDEGEVREL